MQQRFEYWGYSLVEKFICALPDESLPLFAKQLAILTFHVLRIRRNVSLQNLQVAFPEKSSAWRQNIAFRSYHHFALVILEFMKMRCRTPEKIRRTVAGTNAGIVLNSLKEGKGAILVSGHFGNWEIGMAYLHTLRIKSAVIQQRQKNRLINQKMKNLREHWGMKIIYPRGAVEACITELHSGKAVGILGDQDGGKRGVFVPFFGRQSSTHIGAAMLHLKTGAPLFFAAPVRRPDGRYEVNFSPLPYFSPGEITQQILQHITALHTGKLESAIRHHPEQYFWMHRRWKTSPPAKTSPQVNPDLK